MKLSYIHNLFLGTVFVLICFSLAHSQHISFTPLAGNNSIVVTQGFPNELVFGHLFVDSENIKSISLESPDAAWFQIEAPAHYDITVYVEWETPPGLMQHLIDQDATIPFKLSFAYANRGEATVFDAKNNATVVPDGLFSASFPVIRRLNGLPTPPPTPEFSGYHVPKKIFWLFFFGDVGPISQGNMVTTGSYTANLNINISFTSYE